MIKLSAVESGQQYPSCWAASCKCLMKTDLHVVLWERFRGEVVNCSPRSSNRVSFSPDLKAMPSHLLYLCTAYQNFSFISMNLRTPTGTSWASFYVWYLSQTSIKTPWLGHLACFFLPPTPVPSSPIFPSLSSTFCQCNGSPWAHGKVGTAPANCATSWAHGSWTWQAWCAVGTTRWLLSTALALQGAWCSQERFLIAAEAKPGVCFFCVSWSTLGWRMQVVGLVVKNKCKFISGFGMRRIARFS